MDLDDLESFLDDLYNFIDDHKDRIKEDTRLTAFSKHENKGCEIILDGLDELIASKLNY